MASLDYEPRIQKKKLQNEIEIAESNVACGQQIVQTSEVKWLCLDKVYDKFHRPNIYDLGGIYSLDVLDYRFICKIEHAGSIFLLHLFIVSHTINSFVVKVAYDAVLRYDKKKNIAYIEKSIYSVQCKNPLKLFHCYLCTYSFTDLDMECLQDMKLYIAITVSHDYNNYISYGLLSCIKLNYDWSILMSNSIDSDFTVVSAEGTKYQVHKAILSMHSIVFKAMLRDETAESKSGCVELVDVHDEDVRFMLEFMYTGTVKNLNKCLSRYNFLPDSPSKSSIVQDVDCIIFANLLILADRYDIRGLWELAEYIISEQIEMFTVLEILVIADLYHSDFLKMKAMCFIKSNSSIIKSTPFKKIKNPSLLKELCLFLAK